MKLRSFIRFAALAILALCLTAEQVRAGEPASIRIAHLQIREDHLFAFLDAVKEEMEAALRVEPGVIAIYAAADTNNPPRWSSLKCTQMKTPIRSTAIRPTSRNISAPPKT